MGNTKSEQQKEKQTNKQNNHLRDHWDSIKYTNICIIGVPEGEKREKSVENVFDEIMAKNISNLEKETDIQP